MPKIPKKNVKTVFCATGIKLPMVPYPNESCMSLSGMSSGPHGQTSAPAHKFMSADMSNEVCYKSCGLHKSIHSALQRDHCVFFDSHSGRPADSAICNVNCPGQFFSVLWWRQLVHVPCDVSVGGSRGGDLFWNAGSQLGTTCQCPRQFVSTVSTRLFLASARAPSGQHLVSHEPVCHLLLRKCVVRQKMF